MNEAQRKAIIKQFRALQSELKTFQSDISRFERELIANNILDAVKKVTKTSTKTAVKVTEKPKRDVRIKGSIKKDPMYDLEVEFSDNGDNYGNPLVNPTAGGEYYVRCRIRQHQDDPLIQGFQLTWSKPTGWTWVDGWGATTYEEAISNPAIITRTAKAPSSNRGGTFRVVIADRYDG